MLQRETSKDDPVGIFSLSNDRTDTFYFLKLKNQISTIRATESLVLVDPIKLELAAMHI